MTYHLAQINIGRLVAPIDNPKIAEFVAGWTNQRACRSGAGICMAAAIGVGKCDGYRVQR